MEESPDEIEVCKILLDLGNMFRESVCRWGCKRRRSSGGGGGGEFSARNIVKVLSPDTPLSFCPTTESDDNKHSQKRSREEWKREIEGLTHCKEMLIQQLETVRVHYDTQRLYNLKLKAMKQEEKRRRQQQLLTSSFHKQQEAFVRLIGPARSVAQQLQYPVIVGQKDWFSAQGFANNGFGPDLNAAAAAESMKKAMYAEARRSRMNKLKIRGRRRP
ncbi:unnamed protein product [Cuscuta epithymum]|uniref:Uncharacterized protein n=1 Tax=Cuscuta epithymum TaxID=186058 RepID=A0AAV0G595_9ASTE|nr:unnamed protein product [Cuscuta epithymum]CAH9142410.1 unnamed protein product [Cuscuta epithymum]